MSDHTAMSMWHLVVKSIRGNAIRNLVAFLCVLGVSAFFMSTMVVSRGVQQSMDKGLQRMGADILVVPYGAQTDIETALLMGKPSHIWMPQDDLALIAGIDGVAAVSPQIYLQSLYQAACCSVSETFLVVYDPATDFTITPWLQQTLGRPLATGEVIGGAYIFSPDGDGTVKLYGTSLNLVGNLEPTGTGLDQTIFFTLDTAHAMAAASVEDAVSPLVIPQGEISSVLVKLEPGVDARTVVSPIYLNIPDVVPIPSPQLFGTFRDQMLGVLGGLFVFVTLAWLLAAIMVGLVFASGVNERQRQMAVFRAIGATRWYVIRSLLAEGSLLAVAAATAGSLIGVLGIFVFQAYFSGTLKMPFLFPSAGTLLGLYAVSLVISLVTVTIATVYPALRINQVEPALGMRE
jgi:putative ABC transport system permease protein